MPKNLQDSRQRLILSSAFSSKVTEFLILKLSYSKGYNIILQFVMHILSCRELNIGMQFALKTNLGAEQQDKIFASRYQLYLPTEAELRRELEQLQINLNRE